MAAKKSAIDINLIRELASLLNESDLNEIQVEEGDLRLKLLRKPAVAAPVVASVAAAPVAAAPVAVAAPIASAAAPAEAVVEASSGTPITSPMVGTAYTAPAPGANIFVKVGDTVKVGQTIMIVEAMKTMNQIPSTHDGVVEAINVEDGQPVEFGETLITLK